MASSEGNSGNLPFQVSAQLMEQARQTAAKVSPAEIARKAQQAEEQYRRTRNPSMQSSTSASRTPLEQSMRELTTEEPNSPQAIHSIEGENPAAQEQSRRPSTGKGKRKSLIQDQEERRNKKTQVREGRSGSSHGKSSDSEAHSPYRPESSTAAGPFDNNSSHNPHSQSVAIMAAKYFPRPLPAWYTSISQTSHQMKELGKKKPQALASLDAMKDCITRCEQETRPAKLSILFDELRDHVHKAEILLQVDKYIMRMSRILTDSGLPRIFNESAKFPSDLKGDAYQLYNRWMTEDFAQDILRGIVTVKGKDRNGDRLDEAYRARYPSSAKFYGQGDLVNGQWWPTQLAVLRDGAHGSAQGGIYGESEKGAYSIIVSSGTGYEDEDHGTTLFYSGTESKNSNPTENTIHLMTSCRLGKPVRVIRSSGMSKKNPYRPEVGFRYDGLYTVTTYTVTNEDKAVYRFRLERCEGQEEIRYKDNAARRPTIFEIREMERLKSKVW